MTIELKVLEDELAALPAETRLQLARRLIDSVLAESQAVSADPARALLAWAGRFSGGPGNTAEQAETILQEAARRDGFDDQP
jgi:hypothetical protein